MDSLFDVDIPASLTLAQDVAPPIGIPGDTSTAQPANPALGPSGQPGGGPGVAPSPFGGGFIWFILVMFLFMIGMQMFSGRKEKKRRAEMLGSIARHDRVQTTGGLIGTVSEVRDTEVVLKVDEATNTKVRITRHAVAQVLKKSSERAEDAAPAEPEKIAS